MKFAIIIPYKYTASKNILNHLLKLNLPKNVEIVKVEKESIHNENLDKEIDADFFIFATRHQSQAGVKSLCVHPIGNFSKNEVGGKAKELGIAMPSLMKNAFLKLKEFNLKGYEVEFEATHHGPYLEKPCMFIEIGSSKKEWSNPQAGKVIAETISHMIKSKKTYKSCIVLGGGHYNQAVKKILTRTNYAIGHVCPKHNLESLDEKMLRQMIQRSADKIDLVVLDWKGLKQKEKIIPLLDKLNIKYERYDKLK